MASTLTTFDLLRIGMKCNLPVAMWSDPGMGKTALANQIGAIDGYYVKTVVSSLYEPSEVGGIPFRSDVTNDIEYSTPMLFRDLLKGNESQWGDKKEAACFLDELTTAATDTQNAFLKVVDEHRAGTHEISPRCHFIAAGNFTNVSGNKPFQQALANRFMHIVIDPASDTAKADWLHYMSTGRPRMNDALKFNPDPDAILPELKARLASCIKNTEKTANGESIFHNMPTHFESPAQYAYATPRTLERAASMAALLWGNPATVILDALTCLIGAGAAPIVTEFLMDREHVSWDDVKDPKTFKLPTHRPDIMDAFVGLTASKMCDATQFDKVITLYQRILESGSGAGMGYAAILATNFMDHVMNHPDKSLRRLPKDFNDALPNVLDVKRAMGA